MEDSKICVQCGKKFVEPWWFFNGYWCESCVDAYVALKQKNSKQKNAK